MLTPSWYMCATHQSVVGCELLPTSEIHDVVCVDQQLNNKTAVTKCIGNSLGGGVFFLIIFPWPRGELSLLSHAVVLAI